MAYPVHRRTLLGAALPLAIGAATHFARAAAGDVDVAIVGAGAAGIAAARKLVARGLSCIVLEARGRVGGRVWTRTDTFGVPVDEGAAWIHSFETSPLGAIARQLGIPTRLSDRNDSSFYRNGREDADATDAYVATETRFEHLAAARTADGSDLSLSQLAGNDRLLRIFAEMICSSDMATAPSRTSVLDILAGAPGTDQLPAGGYGTLISGLAAGLPIRLNTVVRQVDWSGANGVVLRGDFGAIAARACIVTIPTSLLNAGGIGFTPALPAQFQNAFAGLPLGLMTKIGFRLNRPIAGLHEFGASTTLALQLKGQVIHLNRDNNVALVLTGGDLANQLVAAGDLATLDFGRVALADVMGNSVLQAVERSHVTRWDADPFARGAYSGPLPGHLGDRQIYNQTLDDRVLFAGEAADNPFASTVGGAWQSGESAASRLITRLGR